MVVESYLMTNCANKINIILLVVFWLLLLVSGYSTCFESSRKYNNRNIYEMVIHIKRKARSSKNLNIRHLAHRKSGTCVIVARIYIQCNRKRPKISRSFVFSGGYKFSDVQQICATSGSFPHLDVLKSFLVLQTQTHTTTQCWKSIQCF